MSVEYEDFDWGQEGNQLPLPHLEEVVEQALIRGESPMDALYREVYSNFVLHSVSHDSSLSGNYYTDYQPGIHHSEGNDWLTSSTPTS